MSGGTVNPLSCCGYTKRSLINAASGSAWLKQDSQTKGEPEHYAALGISGTSMASSAILH